MTYKRKAEILTVLQEEYGVLKEYVLTDFVLTGNVRHHLIDSAFVMDALWEWLITKSGFRIRCNNIEWLAYDGLREYCIDTKLYPNDTDSNAKWLITEWILQQKGEL